MVGGYRFAIAFVGFAMLGAAGASAEPQILGVIASLEPVTLQCGQGERGQCSAEFTSYCIEQHRRPPSLGTAYNIYDPKTLIVEGVKAGGEIIRLGDPGLIDIASARGRSAVRISVPAKLLKEFDLASVRVTVRSRVTLIPVPIPDARRPHTEYDIAMATGPLRDISQSIIDEGGVPVVAALQTAKLINALPRAGRASEAQRDQVWGDVGLSPDSSGYTLVEDGFDRCYRVTRSGMMTLRQCLGSVHDRLISKLNVEYWEAVEPGS